MDDSKYVGYQSRYNRPQFGNIQISHACCTKEKEARQGEIDGSQGRGGEVTTCKIHQRSALLDMVGQFRYGEETK